MLGEMASLLLLWLVPQSHGTAREEEICVSTLVALMVNSVPFLSKPVIMTLLLFDGTVTAFPSTLAS